MTHPAGAVGVDLGGSKLLAVRGEAFVRQATGAGLTPDRLEAMLRDALGALGGAPAGLGLAVPGLVDEHGRIVACDVLPGLQGWCPRERLADLADPIVVLNDVQAALIEESAAAPDHPTMAVVMAGTGIGAALQAEGRPLAGARGWAGELGYLPMRSGDRVLRLDELAGGAFMAARRGVSPQVFAELVREGDPVCAALIREGGGALGLGLATLINLFNPSRVAVGGGLLDLPGYWEAACTTAREHTLATHLDVCELGEVKAGALVVARGAARCAAAGPACP